ncbi:hypothetical protein [Mesorhizobium sp. L-8-3]|uniref:hypothetical protein n=1 Tax=Mesorhizobium sp. L-8-3 TaxID=2744522 RepID=UPI00192789B8|nr:hypothetical protein [Mesorhizobium sp. L-8-3]
MPPVDGSIGAQPPDAASGRVAQAFETALGGDLAGRFARDRVTAFAQSLAEDQMALSQPLQPDPWGGLRDTPVAPEHGGPTRLVPEQGEAAPSQDGGWGWRELLGALAPAIAAADPWGRNQGLASTLMQQQQDRRQDVMAARGQNKTRDWLIAQGMDAGTADLLVSDPTLLRQWFSERQRRG